MVDSEQAFAIWLIGVLFSGLASFLLAFFAVGGFVCRLFSERVQGGIANCVGGLVAVMGFSVLWLIQADLADDRRAASEVELIAREASCQPNEFFQMSDGLVHFTDCPLSGFDVFPSSATPGLEGLRENLPEGGVEASWLFIRVNVMGKDKDEDDAGWDEASLELTGDQANLKLNELVVSSKGRIGAYDLSPEFFEHLPKQEDEAIHLRKSLHFHQLPRGMLPPTVLDSTVLQVDPSDDTVLYSGGPDTDRVGDVAVSFSAGIANGKVSAFGDLQGGTLYLWKSTGVDKHLGRVEVGSVPLKEMLEHHLSEKEFIGWVLGLPVVVLEAAAVALLVRTNEVHTDAMNRRDGCFMPCQVVCCNLPSAMCSSLFGAVAVTAFMNGALRLAFRMPLVLKYPTLIAAAAVLLSLLAVYKGVTLGMLRELLVTGGHGGGGGGGSEPGGGSGALAGGDAALHGAPGRLRQSQHSDNPSSPPLCDVFQVGGLAVVGCCCGSLAAGIISLVLTAVVGGRSAIKIA